MKRKRLFLVSLGLLIFIFISIVYVWNNGTPFGKHQAIEYALDLISDEYEMEEQELVLFGTKYFPGKGHYTVVFIDYDLELYVADVKLKAFSTDYYFIENRTNSYDKDILLDILD